MSEPTASAAPPARPARPPGVKYAGLTRNQWIGVGVVFVVVAGVIIWRRHAAAAAGPASSASSGAGDCTDASGNSVPCDQADLSGELSALQTEIETLMAQEGSAGGAGGGGTVPSGGGTGTGSGTGSSSGSSSGTGTTSSSGSSSGTGTTTTGKKTAPTQVGGVRSTKVTPTSVTIAWTANPAATSYRIRVTYQSQLVKQQAATGTSATISGLTPDHTYGIHVAGVNSAGTGPEGTYDVKTPKK
jgi:hypothetical protein